jgi:hypothetical protein
MDEPELGRVERNLTCETFRRHWTSMFKIHVENLKSSVWLGLGDQDLVRQPLQHKNENTYGVQLFELAKSVSIQDFIHLSERGTSVSLISTIPASQEELRYA